MFELENLRPKAQVDGRGRGRAEVEGSDEVRGMNRGGAEEMRCPGVRE